MIGSFLKNKKGIAIESAIFTMLMVFALCSIIMTVSMLMIQGMKTETQAYNERIQVDQIGEDFLYAVEKGGLYQKDDDLDDGIDNGRLTVAVEGDNGAVEQVLFEPATYLNRFNTDEKKLLWSLTAPKNGVGLYVLTLQKDTTYITDAVLDEEGNVIREESETVVTSHLLTVSVMAYSVDGVMTYELTHWSYLD